MKCGNASKKVGSSELGEGGWKWNDMMVGEMFVIAGFFYAFTAEFFKCIDVLSIALTFLSNLSGPLGSVTSQAPTGEPWVFCVWP